MTFSPSAVSVQRTAELIEQGSARGRNGKVSGRIWSPIRALLGSYRAVKGLFASFAAHSFQKRPASFSTQDRGAGRLRQCCPMVRGRAERQVSRTRLFRDELGLAAADGALASVAFEFALWPNS